MGSGESTGKSMPNIDGPALDELRRSEERFRLLFESTGDGLVMADVDTLQLGLSNRKFREMTGFSVEELYDLRVPDMHPVEDWPFISRELDRRLRGEVETPVEIPLKRKDGSVFEVSVNSTVIELAGRRWVLGAFRDVTERKRAENLLRRRYEEMAALTALSREVSASLSFGEVARRTVERVSAATGADLALLFRREGRELILQSSHSSDPGLKRGEGDVHRVGVCLCGLAAESGEGVYSDDIRSDSRCTLSECKSAGIRSFAALPLVYQGEAIGLLGLACTRKRDFSESASFLESLSGHLALALHNAVLYGESQSTAVRLEKALEDGRGAFASLREERDRAQHYLDIAGTAIVALDTGGRVSLINRKGLDILGYGEIEVLEQDWFEGFLPAGDRARAREIFERMMTGDVQPVEYVENRVVTADGETRLMAWRNSLLRDRRGGISGTLSSGEDITESRAAAEALRVSEQRYRNFVEKFTGIAFRSNLEFKPEFFHGAVEEITGYREEDFLDGGLRWDRVMHPDDLERLLREGVLQKPHRVPDYFHELEYRIVRRDGEVRWVHETLQNICDPGGKPIALQGTVVDVTERKLMEEERRLYARRLEAEVAERTREIRASEERHRALFENVDHAVVTTDLAGCVLSCNPATERIFGTREADVRGLEVHQALCGGENREAFREMLASVIRTGTATHECAARTAEGRDLSVNASVSTLRDRSGKPEGMIWILTDLSERERLAAEASRAHEYADMVLRSYGAYGQLVGRGEVFRRIIDFVHDAARVSSAVLLGGESGTGKEAVARSIHSYSGRSEQPFVVVDCAALKGSLLENELFGHERGAFTGAHEAKRGLVEVADGGTLFLDEIGEMPVELQAKLLRVLEHGEFRRVGSVSDGRTDIRVIAATNRDLVAESRQGRFRTDLYFRLNVLSFVIPPLRERPEDIPLLAGHFLMHSRVTFVGRKRFRTDALRQMENYDWPGNVRELANVVERAVILSGNESVLRLAHLPPEVRSASDTGPHPEAAGVKSIAEAEKEAVRAALRATGGNRTRAAAVLGISTVTLRKKIGKYGIEPARGRPSGKLQEQRGQSGT